MIAHTRPNSLTNTLTHGIKSIETSERLINGDEHNSSIRAKKEQTSIILFIRVIYLLHTNATYSLLYTRTILHCPAIVRERGREIVGSEWK